MERNELISVIIPVYNREALIKRAIDSVLNQTYKNIEVIVIDDGSTDKTGEVINAIMDKRIIFYKFDKNRGVVAARNYGISKAKGKYIAFQDSDDYWFEKKLEMQYKEICDKKSKFCFCKFVFNGSPQIVIPSEDSFQLEDTEYGILDILIDNNKVGCPTILAEKEFIQSIGMFDNSLCTLEDWELALRAANETELTFVNKVLVEAGISEDGVNSIRGNGRWLTEVKILQLYWKKYQNKGVFYNIVQNLYEDLEMLPDETRKLAFKEIGEIVDETFLYILFQIQLNKSVDADKLRKIKYNQIDQAHEWLKNLNAEVTNIRKWLSELNGDYNNVKNQLCQYLK